MKKKTYFQTFIPFQLLEIGVMGFLSIGGLCLVFLYAYSYINSEFAAIMRNEVPTAFSDNMKPFYFVVSIIGTFVCGKYFIGKERLNITVSDQKVSIPSDLVRTSEKIQFKDEVNICDIISISIIMTRNNSKGTFCRQICVNPADFSYLQIIDNKGEKHNFYIMYMCKRTIRKLINDIKRRIVLVGNSAQIDDTDLIMKNLKRWFDEFHWRNPKKK